MPVALLIAALLTQEAPAKPDLGAKIAKYCESSIGRKVGGGECADLANAALKSAGITSRRPADSPVAGDYVWGTPVYKVWVSGGKINEWPDSKGRKGVRPGDIIQLRDISIATTTGNTRSVSSYSHHTSVVASIDADGLKWKVYEQNINGKRIVMTNVLNLANLKSGYMTVYRVEPDN